MFKLQSVQCDIDKVLRDRGLDEGGKVQKYIDSECLRLCAPKVPEDTGALIESGNMNTQIGSGEIKYRTPYARRWYFRSADFQWEPERGNYWFERMKQQYKDKILKGAEKKAHGGNG